MPDRLSIIGVGLRVDGHLVGDGSVEVEGHFEGALHIGGELRVCLGAVVQAEVLASRVLVEGRLTGRVRATKEIRVAASGLLEGDVDGPLVLEPGATWLGERVGAAMRPSKTAGSREPGRSFTPDPTDEDDRRTEGGLRAVGPVEVGVDGPTRQGAEASWYAAPGEEPEIGPDSSDLDALDGEPPPAFSLSDLNGLSDEAITRHLAGLGERWIGLPELPDLSAPPEEPSMRATHRREQDDPTDLPRGPSQLVIPDPPRPRTTSPGVRPFRQVFGDAMPPSVAPAQRPRTAPRLAAVSTTASPPAAPSTRPATAPPAGGPPVQASVARPPAATAAPASPPRRSPPTRPSARPPGEDADLSDSWFIPDDDA